MSFSAIIWDMDGTLVDSEPLWEISTLEMSEAIGKRLSPELRQATIGGNFDNTCRICEEHAGVTLTPSQREHFRHMILSRTAELFDERLELNPGIHALLDECVAENIPMALATNTPRELANHEIAAVGGHYFLTTICGDEVPHGKPAPDMYHEACDFLKVEPESVLVFEDSTTGMIAARDAGCVVLGLPVGKTIVPDGVVALSSLLGQSVLTGAAGLNGAHVADLRRWFDEVTAQRF